MVRRSLIVAALLFLSNTLCSAGLFAATADVYIIVTTPAVADAGNGTAIDVTIRNAGPDAAANVGWSVTGSGFASIQCFGRTNLPSLAAKEIFQFRCFTNSLRKSEAAVVTATVSSDTPDPDASNNTSTATIEWIAGPNLGIYAYAAPRAIDPGLPYDVVVQYWNTGLTAATDTIAVIDLPVISAIQKIPDSCTADGSRITCYLGRVDNNTNSGTGASLRLTVLAPDFREGSNAGFHAKISGREREGDLSNNDYNSSTPVYRTFVVDRTTDSGSGSLRAAIEAANAACRDATICKIAFRLSDTPGGFATIRVLTPLPAVTATSLAIDGTTQTRKFGDHNGGRPPIFLDGSASSEGNGLTLSSPCVTNVQALAIGNFPDSAIALDNPGPPCAFKTLGEFREIAGTYIGVDPTGTHAAPNGRGVFMSWADYYPFYTIRDNVISGNRRSGIFLQRAAYTTIARNIIGLDAGHAHALGNGASGIYIAQQSNDVTVSNNYIAFNHDAGISVDRNTSGVDITTNSIFANWQPGIDIGLDGPGSGTTQIPVITSAHYDAASDTTILDGSINTSGFSFPKPVVRFFASDARHPSGYGDGQYYLGEIRFLETAAFHFVTKGDWRGKWVSATNTTNQYFGFARVGQPQGEFPDTHSSTSEFSRAVEVGP
jgi:parallel beta-helix repeat protein